MCYFLCYELKGVKKEEVDFWTSRHEQVKESRHLEGILEELEPCPVG